MNAILILGAALLAWVVGKRRGAKETPPPTDEQLTRETEVREWVNPDGSRGAARYIRRPIAQGYVDDSHNVYLKAGIDQPDRQGKRGNVPYALWLCTEAEGRHTLRSLMEQAAALKHVIILSTNWDFEEGEHAVLLTTIDGRSFWGDPMGRAFAILFDPAFDQTVPYGTLSAPGEVPGQTPAGHPLDPAEPPMEPEPEPDEPEVPDLPVEPMEPETPVWVAYTLRGPETASGLARYYTGQAKRWREILPLNPDLRVVDVPITDPDLVAIYGETSTQVLPWDAGDTIALPASWGVDQRPLPTGYQAT